MNYRNGGKAVSASPDNNGAKKLSNESYDVVKFKGYFLNEIFSSSMLFTKGCFRIIYNYVQTNLNICSL
jgi:hypothetical protein